MNSLSKQIVCPTEIGFLQTRLKEIDNDLENLKPKLYSEKDTIAQLTKENIDLNEKLSEILIDSENKTKEIKNLQAELISIDKQMKELKNLLSLQKTETEILAERCKNYSDMLVKSESYQERLKAEMIEAKCEHKSEIERMERLMKFAKENQNAIIKQEKTLFDILEALQHTKLQLSDKLETTIPSSNATIIGEGPRVIPKLNSSSTTFPGVFNQSSATKSKTASPDISLNISGSLFQSSSPSTIPYPIFGASPINVATSATTTIATPTSSTSVFCGSSFKYKDTTATKPLPIFGIDTNIYPNTVDEGPRVSSKLETPITTFPEIFSQNSARKSTTASPNISLDSISSGSLFQSSPHPTSNSICSASPLNIATSITTTASTTPVSSTSIFGVSSLKDENVIAPKSSSIFGINTNNNFNTSRSVGDGIFSKSDGIFSGLSPVQYTSSLFPQHSNYGRKKMKVEQFKFSIDKTEVKEECRGFS